MKLGDRWPPLLFAGGVASVRAEIKEKRSCKNRRKRFKWCMEGVQVRRVVAPEKENGEGVGNGCWVWELATDTGETPAMIVQAIAITCSLSSFSASLCGSIFELNLPQSCFWQILRDPSLQSDLLDMEILENVVGNCMQFQGKFPVSHAWPNYRVDFCFPHQPR